ncbi:MAG: N-acetylmuramoyl-L-alanine amidase [Lachnospiraceae bacterium]|nr:N-acetylmuramoyl-L-alanine amidase [Lachnospiraceae bacterium]
MRKKLTAAVLTVLLVLCLAACGDKQEDEDIKKYDKVGKYDNDDKNPPTASADDLTKTPDAPTGTPTPTPKPHKFVVVLDPGHGGKDPGAGYDGRRESTLNLKLANMIRDYLMENYNNVTVYLTREDDVELDPEKGPDLRARVQVGVDLQADIVVSLHLNASENHKQHGSMVCISKQPNITEQSKKLADCILARLENLGLKNNGTLKRDSLDTFDDNGVPVDYYAICRHGASNNLISIIVESCFIDNDSDAKFLKTEEDLMKLAEAESKGIMEFLNQYYKGNGEG